MFEFVVFSTDIIIFSTISELCAPKIMITIIERQYTQENMEFIICVEIRFGRKLILLKWGKIIQINSHLIAMSF